jgi:hypothetical protein
MLDETIANIIGPLDESEHTPEYGDRAWLFRGEWCDVLIWDDGNGHSTPLAVLPKSMTPQQREECLVAATRFYELAARYAPWDEGLADELPHGNPGAETWRVVRYSRLDPNDPGSPVITGASAGQAWRAVVALRRSGPDFYFQVEPE